MGEIECIPLAVSHYGEANLAGSILKWEAVRGQSVLDAGRWTLAEVKYGELTPAGATAVNLPAADQGFQLDLRVTLEKNGRVLLFSHGAVIEQDQRYYPGMPNFYTYYRALPWNAGPGNSGSVITPHPALADFPCEGLCDLQFVWGIRGVIPMCFDPLRRYGR